MEGNGVDLCPTVGKYRLIKIYKYANCNLTYIYIRINICISLKYNLIYDDRLGASQRFVKTCFPNFRFLYYSTYESQIYISGRAELSVKARSNGRYNRNDNASCVSAYTANQLNACWFCFWVIIYNKYFGIIWNKRIYVFYHWYPYIQVLLMFEVWWRCEMSKNNY